MCGTYVFCTEQRKVSQYTDTCTLSYNHGHPPHRRIIEIEVSQIWVTCTVCAYRLQVSQIRDTYTRCILSLVTTTLL